MIRQFQIKRRLQNPWVVFALNLFLAVLIYVFAELGQWVGIGGLPLPVSVFWPPTGLALAALLIFGDRAGYGIFLGNFLYNLLKLSHFDAPIEKIVFTAAAVSLGSLIQAFVGNYFMRRYCYPNYFQTVRNVGFFLIFGGLVTCFIAPTIGLIALYLFSPFPLESLQYIWINFWIGDLMGVYIVTPLLYVWSVLKAMENEKVGLKEMLFLTVLFSLITLLFTWNYPLAQLYIPLSVWVSYRYGLHGATLVIFFIFLAQMIPTTLGQGFFHEFLLPSNRFLVLISYIECLVVTNLLLAALTLEKDMAMKQIQDHNINLQQAMQMHVEDVKDLSSESFMQERMASLGLLTSGISRQIQIPLQKIQVFSKSCLEYVSQAQTLIGHEKDRLYGDLASRLSNYLSIMSNYLFEIAKSETQATRMAKVIEEQAILTSPGKQIKNISINGLLKNCLQKVMDEELRRYPGFKLTVIENLDRELPFLAILPEDLSHALYHILTHALASMKQKKDALGPGYTPTLEIGTRNLFSEIEIKVRDNGLGIAKQSMEHFLSSFLKKYENVPLVEEEGIDLTLTLAYDIVTHIYHGEILADSKEGQYLQLTVLLPKSIPSKS